MRGPNAFPEDYDHNPNDFQEMVRRAAAYDELREAFQNRLAEHGLQAVAFWLWHRLLGQGRGLL